MAITLNAVTEAARAETKSLNGTDGFEMVAGQSLQVRSTPDGEMVLNVEVPSGKSWTVTVDVAIREVAA